MIWQMLMSVAITCFEKKHMVDKNIFTATIYEKKRNLTESLTCFHRINAIFLLRRHALKSWMYLALGSVRVGIIFILDILVAILANNMDSVFITRFNRLFDLMI